MPRGRGLSNTQREVIYTQSTMGESPEDIAMSMNLNPGTVRRIIREQRKMHEKARETMGRSSKIVKKDGRGGKLMALSPDGFEFIHITPDGKSHKKKVPGHMSRIAEQQYDKWCEELDDECEFMRKVERKVEAAFEPTDEYVQVFEDDEPDGTNPTFNVPDDPIESINPIQVIEPAPIPEINVRPWKEVAEERQQTIDGLLQRISELEGDKENDNNLIGDLNKRIEELESKVIGSDHVVMNTEGEAPKLDHWFNDNGSFRVLWMDKPAYVLWAKGENPKLFGVYWNMEMALKEVDKLNEIASFLGSDGAFDVEEVQWK